MASTKDDVGMMEVSGQVWFGLKWVVDAPVENIPSNETTPFVYKGKMLHPDVVPVVYKSGPGKMAVKLGRLDIKENKLVIPLCNLRHTMLRISFFDGNKDQPKNPTHVDQCLSFTFQVTDAAFAVALSEIEQAYVIAVLQTRALWAGASWMQDYRVNNADNVEKDVRSHFGYEPPTDKKLSKEQALADRKLRKVVENPRVPAENEHPGSIVMKLTDTSLIKPIPEKNEREAEVKPEVLLSFEKLIAGETDPTKTSLRRADINTKKGFYSGFFKFGLMGLCPLSGEAGFNVWRVFNGVIQKNVNNHKYVTPDALEEMKLAAGVDDAQEDTSALANSAANGHDDSAVYAEYLEMTREAEAMAAEEYQHEAKKQKIEFQ